MNSCTLKTITYDVSNGIGVITLNRLKVINAMNAKMRQELLFTINYANANSSVRIIVFTGAGRGFCVGQDLAENVGPGDETRTLLDQQYKPLVLAIDESEKLVIAAINGPTAGVGVGVALALACGLIVMGHSAYFYPAFVAIGLIPDGGVTWQLIRHVGYRRALELVVGCTKLTADQCITWGLANLVVTDNLPVDETIQWAEQLAKRAPIAVQHCKSALKAAQHLSLAGAIDIETDIQAAIPQSADAQEGKNAFLENRNPVFKGT